MSSVDPRGAGFRHRAEVAEVEALLADRISPLGPETIPATKSAGRVLAEEVASPVDSPAFDRSAMDGFAVRGEETFGATDAAPLSFRIIGDSRPAHPFDGAVGEGEAVAILTGAPLPSGADAVVKLEDTRRESDRLWVLDPVSPEKNVSRRGEDVRRGQILLPAGRPLRPQDVALLVATGCVSVEVIRRPRVDIVPTGNELLPAGDRPVGTRIVDANSPLLEALVERDGGVPRPQPVVRDDPDPLRRALEGFEGDVILMTGGSSVGAEDHVPSVVRELGELPIHGVAMRPSSPVGVGFLGGRPVFLLPGNPVSCLCAYDFFAGPTIRALGGRSLAWPYATVRRPLLRPLPSQTGRVDYARVRVTDDGVEPLQVSGASILSSTTRADGFVIVPRDDEGLPEGEEVEVHLYG